VSEKVFKRLRDQAFKFMKALIGVGIRYFIYLLPLSWQLWLHIYYTVKTELNGGGNRNKING